MRGWKLKFARHFTKGHFVNADIKDQEVFFPTIFQPCIHVWLTQKRET